MLMCVLETAVFLMVCYWTTRFDKGDRVT